MNKLFLILILTGQLSAKETKIKLYNWWDYISPTVLENIEKNGLKTNLTIYTSNSQAIARLYKNNDKFDLAIVSKFTMESLKDYDVFDKKIFKDLIKSRSYNNLQSNEDFCLPYLWGPTVFINNYSIESGINSSLFLELSNKTNFKIIDDPVEVTTMFVADGTCAMSDTKCITKNYTKLAQIAKSKNFTSHIEKKDFKGKFLFYGWLGALIQALKEGEIKNLNVHIPKRVVIGQDFLCALKNRNSNKADLLKYASILSNQENSQVNENYSGYFSPYLLESKEYTGSSYKILKDLKVKFETRIKGNSYIYLPNINSKNIKSTKKLWERMRYGKP